MRLVVEDAEFADLTFEEFTEWLRRFSEANVVVRWKILADSGVERTEPIALKRRNIALEALLPLVFAQLTRNRPGVELAARADGNTLIISTRGDINRRRLTRVYDVRDLLVTVPHFRGRRIHNLGLDDADAFRLGGDGNRRDRNTIRDPKARRLVRLITTHIQPLSWKVHGGKGTIRYHRGRLIVYNNIEVHQQLAGRVSGGG